MNKLGNILTIVLGVLIAVSAILVIMLVSNLDGAKQDALIELNLNWSYVLLFMGAGAAVIFSILQLFNNPASIKKALISVAAIAGIVVVANMLATDFIPQSLTAKKMLAEGDLTPEGAKWIGTALYGTYILLFLTIGAVLLSSVSRLLKR
ncbi:hypothetical protein EMN47_18535 [Prolixibacteraceae bacterium JC049]|nr:hypothetical protein [Prolixibacteraceae bacterium JC049]